MAKMKSITLDNTIELIKVLKKASGKINRQTLFGDDVNDNEIADAKEIVQQTFANRYSFAKITSGKTVIYNCFTNTQLIILKDQENMKVVFDEEVTNNFADLLFRVIYDKWSINTDVLAKRFYNDYLQIKVTSASRETNNNIEAERAKRKRAVTEVVHSGDYAQQITYIYMRGTMEGSPEKLVDILSYDYNKDIGYGNYKPLSKHNDGVPSVSIDIEKAFLRSDEEKLDRSKEFKVTVNWSATGSQPTEIAEEAGRKIIAAADIANQVKAKIIEAMNEWLNNQPEGVDIMHTQDFDLLYK